LTPGRIIKARIISLAKAQRRKEKPLSLHLCAFARSFLIYYLDFSTRDRSEQDAASFEPDSALTTLTLPAPLSPTADRARCSLQRACTQPRCRARRQCSPHPTRLSSYRERDSAP